MPEFRAWPKTPRLFRDMVVTEKIDGTNAAVGVTADGEVYAQSRNRIITPEADNHGFARWVHENAAVLVPLLGAGLHFGEYWGCGIQRGYGLDEKRFSLFNTDRHADINADIGGVLVSTVPVLYHGPFHEYEVTYWLNALAEMGSVASPGFANPEGVCVWHSQARTVFKATLDNNDAGKWQAP